MNNFNSLTSSFLVLLLKPHLKIKVLLSDLVKKTDEGINYQTKKISKKTLTEEKRTIKGIFSPSQ